jgi:hypothetical protein
MVKRVLVGCLGVAAVGLGSLACTASTTPSEHTATTRQHLNNGDQDPWPINSDCTCPDGLDQASADQCAFAQQFLQVLYNYGATWNGGTGFSQAPTPGNSGACSDSVLPPLTVWSTYTEHYDYSTNSWVSDGYIDDTPAFSASDPAGLFYALVWDLKLRLAPSGNYFGAGAVMFFWDGATWNSPSNYGDFEPTNCPNCFAKW